ncbi:hypothetical protein [Gelatiniphilus marinus]|uniref:Uncharacterized protein n=1 Tax=Gelatiniphilus marinus TaxID=1759464 RepID=A0ABW5JUL4_9FLAO
MINLIKTLAKSYNNLNQDGLESVLDENIIYESQNVLNALEGKQNVLSYLEGKFKTIHNSGNQVYAELGFLDKAKKKPCIILSQGDKENKGALILIEAKNNLITRIDICTVVPHWKSAIQTNEYPK